MSSRIEIHILTADLGWHSSESTGLKQSLQIVEVETRSRELTEKQIIVRATEEPFELKVLVSELEAVFPGHPIGAIILDQPGRVSIAANRTERDALARIAFAVATLHRAWGWDESPEIIVQIPDQNLVFSLNPTVEGGVWSVDPTGA